MKASLEKQREKDQPELLSKAAEHRSALDCVEVRVKNIEDGIQDSVQKSTATLQARSVDVEITKAALMSFQSVKQRIIGFVSAFPSEIRDLLQRILQ